MFRISRFVLPAVLFVGLALTLVLDFHTARAVAQFRTDVLWRDQWWFLGELQSVSQGKSWTEVLWSPYWGHRPVIPRLLFYLDARLFSFRNTPLLSLSWAVLLTQAAMIIGVNRALFGSVKSWRFVAASTVVLNLYFSSFQMENLMWALQIQYIVVLFCALFAFVTFAMSVRAKAHGRLLLGASCLGALLGSLTMANGLLIWPVLAFQSLLCRSRKTIRFGLLLMFLLFGGIYAIGYRIPQIGMGLQGQVKRPLRALEIALMVMGGAISNQSLRWGVAAGAVAVIAGVVFAVMVFRNSKPAWPSVHVAIVFFIGVTAVTTVGARISPEYLQSQIATGGELLPSRYLTFSFLAWTSLAILAAWATIVSRALAARCFAVAVALVPCYFIFGYARPQIMVADAWVDGMRAFDATGTSFLVNASDWERQKVLWMGRSELEGWVEFARANRLANFSETRYLWLDRRLPELFREVPSMECEGKVESVQSLGNNNWRVNGWAWETAAQEPPLDLVLVNGEGRIRGLARSGVRHHETGGHTAKVSIHRAGWLGYVANVAAADVAGMKAYSVLKRGETACPLSGEFSIK